MATPGDAVLLAAAAEISARWISSKRDVEQRGTVLETVVLDKTGNAITKEKKNPHLLIAQECEKQLVAILDRLGLVPRERERVKPAKPAADELPADSVGALLALEEKNAV